MSALNPLARLVAPFRAPAPAVADPFALEPRPLLIRDARLVVAWAPKAGCSHVAWWAFRHEGLLEAAEAHDPWPHKYRQFVYYRDPAYDAATAAIRAAGGRGWTLLRVTREPAPRLVSIFRHACRFAFLEPMVRRRLGFSQREQGLSLRDLDAVLRGKRLVVPTTMNPHVCAQAHPVWDLGFDRVITLNMDETDLDAGLNAVERALGLPATDFAAIPAFARLRAEHYAREAARPVAGPIEDHRFRAADAAAAFPKAAIAASPLLAAMTRRHYRADLGRVASGDSARRLAFA
jgi:hypothetical protein